jgi:hypothetical protein
LAFHTAHCGHENISVVSEDDIDANSFNPKNATNFLKKTKDYFPAFETEFGGKNINEFDPDELREEWYKKEMENLKLWYGKSFPEEEGGEDKLMQLTLYL